MELNEKERIIAFLHNPQNKDNKDGYKLLKILFEQVLNNFDNLRTKYNSEDLLHDFLLDKVLKDSSLLMNKNEYFFSYLKKTITMFLIDITRSSNFKNIRSIKSIDNEENAYKLVQDKQSYNIETLSMLSKELTNIIKEEFSEDEIKTLCYIFLKDENLIDCVSSDAKYKRVERFKKERMPSFIKQYGIEYEVFNFFVKNHLMSEICSKVRYNK